jgi:hypothetical protein
VKLNIKLSDKSLKLLHKIDHKTSAYPSFLETELFQQLILAKEELLFPMQVLNICRYGITFGVVLFCPYEALVPLFLVQISFEGYQLYYNMTIRMKVVKDLYKDDNNLE